MSTRLFSMKIFFTPLLLSLLGLSTLMSATQADTRYHPGFPDYVNGVANSFTYDIFSQKDQITGDAVVLKMNATSNAWEILMIKRGNAPDMNAWATPGGIKDDDKDQDFILRELLEEAGSGLADTQITSKIQKTFTLMPKKHAPLWDVRTHKNPSVHGKVFIVDSDMQVKAGDDARAAKFLPLQSVIDGDFVIAFKHAEWIKEAIQKITLEGDASLKTAFESYSTKEQLDKLQVIIDQSHDRNRGLAMLTNLKRQLDGQPLILDEEGNPILPPQKVATFEENVKAAFASGSTSIVSLAAGLYSGIKNKLISKESK